MTKEELEKLLAANGSRQNLVPKSKTSHKTREAHFMTADVTDGQTTVDELINAAQLERGETRYNYLGGSDFDALIVEKLLVPELNKRGKFTDLSAQMKSESGKYNRLWTVLLHLAEEAKVELSTKSYAEIDLGMIRDLEDESGKAIDTVITFTRSEFESVIKEAIDSTAEMMKKILTRNSLQPPDLKFVLMVGGATYTPYVRKRIEEVMGIAVNSNIDPTNAIAIGAAYFAGAKELSATAVDAKGSVERPSIRIRMAFNRSSQDLEELFSARVEGNTAGLSYRITRDDGAFDSGLVVSRLFEFHRLREL